MSAWKRRQLDRKWMTRAEHLDREENGHVAQTVYYMGGGVYHASWGMRVRGASASRAYIEKQHPEFAMRVSLAAGQIDRTNGGRAS